MTVSRPADFVRFVSCAQINLDTQMNIILSFCSNVDRDAVWTGCSRVS